MPSPASASAIAAPMPRPPPVMRATRWSVMSGVWQNRRNARRAPHGGCDRLPPVDIYEALYTTRAMRRVRPDPIPVDAQQRILDAAIRTPSGGNGQNWRFLLVDDKDVIGRLAPIYQRS